MKRIYKFATGNEVPKGAEYLGTVTQTLMDDTVGKMMPCWLVWHYFLVEVKE